MNGDPLAVVGVSHKTAPLAERERFAFARDRGLELLADFDDESLLLVTCNRTELYALEDSEVIEGRFLSTAGFEDSDRSMARRLFCLEGEEAIDHLFRVSAGLDSMVVGEHQILGQVRKAMKDAREVGSLGPVLDELVRRALRVGRRVRSETSLGEGLPSIPKVAAGMARLVLGELGGHSLLIVGTGKLGALTARTLQRAGAISVAVTNRTPGFAESLAEEIGGRAEPFERLDELLDEADIVLTCTASQEPILTRSRIEGAVADRGDRTLVLIDIAVPRDVEAEVRDVPSVRLYDLDDLRGWGSDAVSPEVIESAEMIVTEETGDFLNWWGGRAAVPTIRELRERAQEILEEELGHARGADEEVLRRFGRRLVKKILHQPTVRLRNGVAEEGDSFLALARELFGLDEEIRGKRE